MMPAKPLDTNGGDAIGHLDGDVLLDEDRIDGGDDDAEDHRGEQAGRSEVSHVDHVRHRGAVGSHTGRNEQQEHEQRGDSDDGRLTLAIKLLGHALADGECGIQGQHVRRVRGHVREHRLEAIRCDEILIGRDAQAGEQRCDRADHDDGQQHAEAARNGLQDFVVGELGRKRDERLLHQSLELLHLFPLLSV